MRRYRAAVTLALALAGCASQREEYAAAVTRGQDRWAAACGVRPVPASVVLVNAVTVARCGGSTAAVGCTDSAGHVTFATRTSAPRDGLVLHELGHVLGAGHHHGPRVGVMVATLDDTRWRPFITEDDLDAVGYCPVRRPERP